MTNIGYTLSMSNYYLHRLADPSLLEHALVTKSGDLAVPVGGARRGGWTQVTSKAEGRQLIEEMQQRPDLFPNPRFGYDGEVIAFGAEEPDDDVEAGSYFGYSDAAIQKFVQKLAEMESRS